MVRHECYNATELCIWWPPAYGNYKGYQIHHVLWSLSNTIKVSGYVYFYIIL